MGHAGVDTPGSDPDVAARAMARSYRIGMLPTIATHAGEERFSTTGSNPGVRIGHVGVRPRRVRLGPGCFSAQESFACGRTATSRYVCRAVRSLCLRRL